MEAQRAAADALDEIKTMDPYRFYLGARTWFGFCWTTMVTVNLVYMVEVAGLDPLQMVLVGTVLELSAFLFEIPTGVLADRVSRRPGAGCRCTCRCWWAASE